MLSKIGHVHEGSGDLHGMLALALLLFLFVPEIDLAASGLFYDPGRGFVLRRLGRPSYSSIARCHGSPGASSPLLQRPLSGFSFCGGRFGRSTAKR